MRVGIVKEKIKKGGGAETVTLNLIEHLLKRGVKVKVYCNSHDEIEGVDVVHVPVLKFTPFLRTLTFSLFSSLICRRKKILTISFGHTLCQHILHAGGGVHKEWLWRRAGGSLFKFIRYCLNPFHVLMMLLQRLQFNRYFTKCIIAPSSSVKEQILRNYHYPPSCIRVIPDGVKDIKESIRKDEGRVIIIFAGSGFERKGLIYLLKAVSLLREERDLQVWIMGKERRERKYKELCKKLKIEKKVVFLGFKNDPFPYYKEAHILCLPSIYEPFGIVVLEAMMAGVVPIVSHHCGVAEIIEDGVDGFVVQTKPEEIAEKIRLLYAERSMMQRMSLCAQRKAAAFCWQNYVERLLDAIKSFNLQRS